MLGAAVLFTENYVNNNDMGGIGRGVSCQSGDPVA